MPSFVSNSMNEDEYLTKRLWMMLNFISNSLNLHEFLDQYGIDFCPLLGTLGIKYEEFGGEVKWMGKPDKIMYKSAMAMAGVFTDSDCVAVGDSLHHDIKGANSAGIQSVFITGGIHADELGLKEFGEPVDSQKVNALVSKFNALPSFVLPSFSW